MTYHRHTCAWLLLLVFAGPAVSTRSAPPTVNYLFPAGACRGTSLEVQASGKLSQWPAKVWVDRPGLDVKPAKEKGKFQFTIAKDAPSGIYLVRVFDKEGASSLRPFVVDRLPELTEKEGNDSLEKAQVLKESSIVNGRLAKSGDVDHFAIQLQRGQTLVVALRANRVLNSPMDGVLQVCDERGFVLAQNDDERGLDPLISMPVPRTGKYFVRTFAFPAKPNSTIGFSGADNYLYRLTITTGAFADHAFPMAVRRGHSTEVTLRGWNLEAENPLLLSASDKRSLEAFDPAVAEFLSLPVTEGEVVIAQDGEKPQAVNVPAVVTGCLEKPKDQDQFVIQAKKGDKLRVQLVSRRLGYPLDPFVSLTDSSGKVVAENDDGGGNRDALLNQTIPADGKYTITVRDVNFAGGFRYVYRLHLFSPQPTLSLKVATDHFVVTKKKALEVPVTVQRADGFAKEVEIAAVGLPKHVTAATVVSATKGATAKSVKLKLTTTGGKAYSGPFRIVGRVKGTETETIAWYDVPNTDRQAAEIWLTVTP